MLPNRGNDLKNDLLRFYYVPGRNYSEFPHVWIEGYSREGKGTCHLAYPVLSFRVLMWEIKLKTKYISFSILGKIKK